MRLFGFIQNAELEWNEMQNWGKIRNLILNKTL